MTPSFFVEPRTLTLRGVEITVSPLAVKNIAKAAKCAAPMVDALHGGVNPMVVMDHADSVITLCALACNQSDEFVGELNAGELLALITLVIEVNMDFFSLTIAPQITQMMQTVQKVAEKVEAKSAGGKKA